MAVTVTRPDTTRRGVDGRARITGAVPCGYVYVDGSSVGGATEELLKDRRILRDEGFIS